MSGLGKVYLVGGGPGDPGLISLRAVECLAEADLVLYDGLVNPLLLRHSRAPAERTCRGGGPNNRRLDQDEINRRLVEAARAGQTVVRLKGGDPLIFGRGLEEARALAIAGIPYEIVPGITAATAAGAYTGIGLTHREHASAVAFVTGHEDPGKDESSLDYRALANFPGTLVFYMGLHRVRQICEQLQAEGKTSDTPVAVVSRATTPFQRTVVGNLGNIQERVVTARLTAPSLIIVGRCVAAREVATWFESRPLLGRNVGIPRAEEQAHDITEQVLELGGQPVLMPSIQIQPVDDLGPLDELLQRLAEIDWLVFTSRNGVDVFFRRLWELGQDARRLSSIRIAAIGPATAAALEQFHVRADLVPDEYRAEGLADALTPHVQDASVVWIRANRGRDVLPERLAAAGARFEELVVYRHIDCNALPRQVRELADRGELHWIALSSPAIAENVARLLPAGGPLPRFAAISPVTEAAAVKSGLAISAVATEHTWPGVLSAIVSAEQACPSIT